jgi:uncharacterized protein (DUF2147 family)
MNMKQILAKTGLVLLAFAVPAMASAQATLAGEWRNPHGTVVVRVSPCGNAYCGTISWASARNREKGNTPGTRVLRNLRPVGDGVYKGSAYDPKHDMDGTATVRQAGPNVMIVKGCAILGLVCREQRWTRVS